MLCAGFPTILCTIYTNINSWNRLLTLGVSLPLPVFNIRVEHEGHVRAEENINEVSESHKYKGSEL